MAKYAKCPRCELNYIDVLKQQYCDVCLKEMKGLTDEDPLFQDEEEETELCPICGENMMRAGEKMCEECKQRTAYEEEPEESIDMENDEEWRNYLDDESTEGDAIDIGEEDLSDELGEEEEEEEEPEEEDFEYVTGDEIYQYSDDFDDEDEDDDFDEDEDESVPAKKKSRKKEEDF